MLRYTLLSDGSSDLALMPILSWLLQAGGVQGEIQAEWADLRKLRRPPRELPERIIASIDLYPCDLLFIHRDAENLSRYERVEEIERAVCAAGSRAGALPPEVCVVPVRMQEAWLLFDESAIRLGAGNPNGRQPLPLPDLRRLEELPDPKAVLYDLLREASGLSGRRRRSFSVSRAVHRTSEFVNDFSPLRVLPAFQALEDDLRGRIEHHHWNQR